MAIAENDKRRARRGEFFSARISSGPGLYKFPTLTINWKVAVMYEASKGYPGDSYRTEEILGGTHRVVRRGLAGNHMQCLISELLMILKSVC